MAFHLEPKYVILLYKAIISEEKIFRHLPLANYQHCGSKPSIHNAGLSQKERKQSQSPQYLG